MNNKKIIEDLIREFYPYAKKRLQLKEKLHSVSLKEDEANAGDPLGKTAFYDPDQKSITVYISNRHPKDILRSFSHELVHHKQNCENQIGDLSTGEGYAQKDPAGRKLEEEAYLEGNLIFRDWEDSKKENNDMSIQKLNEVKRKKINQKLKEAFGYKTKYDQDASIMISSEIADYIKMWGVDENAASGQLVIASEAGQAVPIETAYKAIDELEKMYQEREIAGKDEYDESWEWNRDQNDLAYAIAEIEKELKKNKYM